MEIDKLQISVSADTSQAIQAYDKLGKALQRLNKVTKENYGFSALAMKINQFAKTTATANKALKELADSLATIHRVGQGEGLTKTAKSIEKMNKMLKPKASEEGGTSVVTPEPPGKGSGLAEINEDLDEQGKKLPEVKSKWDKFNESVWKIVKYRAVRKVLSEISKAASDGTKNLYTFLNAQDDKDSKRMLTSLDRLSTSMQALGNTLGVTLISLLVTIQPILTTLSEGLMQIMEVFNALVSALKGGTTYIAANREALKKWSETVNHALQGFDELNVISGDTGANPFNMFSVKENSEALEGLGKEAAAVGGLTAALGLGKIATNLLKEAFVDKNKTLKEQTGLTKKEAETVGGLSGVFSTVLGAVKTFSTGFGVALGIAGALGVVMALVGGIDGIKEALGKIDFSGFAAKAKEAFEKVGQWVADLVQSLKDFAKEKFSATVEIFTKITQLTTAPEVDTIPDTNPAPVPTPAPVPVPSPSTSTSTNVKPNLPPLPVTSTTTNDLTETMKKIATAAGVTAGGLAIGMAMKSMNKSDEFLGVKWGGAFASGGFVDSGQVFTARENGMPEMVGRIGNRTAVANNDQITEAIASAVYDAITSANLGNVNVTLEGDAKKLFKVVQSEARNYSRSTLNYAF